MIILRLGRWLWKLVALGGIVVVGIVLVFLAAAARSDRRAALSDPEAMAHAVQLGALGGRATEALVDGSSSLEETLGQGDAMVLWLARRPLEPVTRQAFGHARETWTALARDARDAARLGRPDHFRSLLDAGGEAIHVLVSLRRQDGGVVSLLDLDSELLGATLGRAGVTAETLVRKLEAAVPTPVRCREETVCREAVLAVSRELDPDRRRLEAIGRVERSRDVLLHSTEALGTALARDADTRLERLDSVILGVGGIGVFMTATAMAFALREWRRRPVERRLNLQLLALEQLSESVILSDASGHVIYANPAFERLSGYPASELLGKTPRVLRSGVHEMAFYQELWATILAGRNWFGRIVNRRKDGSLYELHQSISPLQSSDGRAVGFAAVGRDVTGEQQSERLRTLGTLVAEVAHEINNPANTLTLGGSLLADALPEIERHFEARELPPEAELCGRPWRESLADLRDLVEGLLGAADRIATFVRDLRGFASPDDVRPVVFAPNEAIVAAVRLMQHEFKALSVDVKLELEGVAPHRVKGRPRRFEQLVMNILSNSSRALAKSGGKVRVAGRRDGSQLELVFEDDGPGVPPELVTRLFEPFVSGRRDQGGTGLGLALCARVASEMGGTITLDPQRPGSGASFRVRIPLCEDQPTAATATASPLASGVKGAAS